MFGDSHSTAVSRCVDDFVHREEQHPAPPPKSSLIFVGMTFALCKKMPT